MLKGHSSDICFFTFSGVPLRLWKQFRNSIVVLVGAFLKFGKEVIQSLLQYEIYIFNIIYKCGTKEMSKCNLGTYRSVC